MKSVKPRILRSVRLLAGVGIVFALAAVFLFTHHSGPLALAETIEVKIEANTIPHFQVGVEDRTQFGSLKYLSGIEYTSSNEKLGGISGIRMLDGGRRFLAVSDKGAWFSGQIERDAAGKIIGILNARIAPLRDTKGKIITSKKKGDAEGLEIIGNRALVSFERSSRIYSYKLDMDKLASTAKSFRPTIKRIKLPNNNGLEAIIALEDPGTNELKGIKIAVFSEHSLDSAGNIRGFVSRKKKWKEFSVRAIGKFKITDAARLPDGDILILERQFSVTTGPLIRIRKLQTALIKPGALLEGETLFEADVRYQIDNLEGLSIWVNDLGQTILTIVSDNNFSFLQRNLMLEFELTPAIN